MTLKVNLEFLDTLEATIGWETGSRKLRNLADIQGLLPVLPQLDNRTIGTIGVLVVLFATSALWRMGTELTRSNIVRVLDEYYFVLQDQSLNSALQGGLDAAIDKIDELRRENREDEFANELQQLIIDRSR